MGEIGGIKQVNQHTRTVKGPHQENIRKVVSESGHMSAQDPEAVSAFALLLVGCLLKL